MFLLHCPHCKHQMKYQNQKAALSEGRKRCVYCGKSFGVKKNIVKQL